jgi:hypothetical protein
MVALPDNDNLVPPAAPIESLQVPGPSAASSTPLMDTAEPSPAVPSASGAMSAGQPAQDAGGRTPVRLPAAYGDVFHDAVLAARGELPEPLPEDHPAYPEHAEPDPEIVAAVLDLEPEHARGPRPYHTSQKTAPRQPRGDERRVQPRFLRED